MAIVAAVSDRLSRCRIPTWPIHSLKDASYSQQQNEIIYNRPESLVFSARSSRLSGLYVADMVGGCGGSLVTASRSSRDAGADAEAVVVGADADADAANCLHPLCPVMAIAGR